MSVQPHRPTAAAPLGMQLLGLPDDALLPIIHELDAEATIALLLIQNVRLRRVTIGHLQHASVVWARAERWLATHAAQLPISQLAQILYLHSKTVNLHARWPLEFYFRQRKQRMPGKPAPGGISVQFLVDQMAHPFQPKQVASFMDAFYALFEYLTGVLLIEDAERLNVDTHEWLGKVTTPPSLLEYERTLQVPIEEIRQKQRHRDGLLPAAHLWPLRRAFIAVCTYACIVPKVQYLRVHCTDSRVMTEQILPLFHSMSRLNVFNVDFVDMKRLLQFAACTPQLAELEVHGRTRYDRDFGKVDDVPSSSLPRRMVRTLKMLTLNGCHFLDDQYLGYVVRRTFNISTVHLVHNPFITDVGNAIMMDELNKQRPNCYHFVRGSRPSAQPVVDPLEALQWMWPVVEKPPKQRYVSEQLQRVIAAHFSEPIRLPKRIAPNAALVARSQRAPIAGPKAVRIVNPNAAPIAAPIAPIQAPIKAPIKAPNIVKMASWNAAPVAVPKVSLILARNAAPYAAPDAAPKATPKIIQNAAPKRMPEPENVAWPRRPNERSPRDDRTGQIRRIINMCKEIQAGQRSAENEQPSGPSGGVEEPPMEDGIELPNGHAQEVQPAGLVQQAVTFHFIPLVFLSLAIYSTVA